MLVARCMRGIHSNRAGVVVIAGCVLPCVLLCSLGVVGCSRGDSDGNGSDDAGAAALLLPVVTSRSLAPFEEQDPVEALLQRGVPRAGACAQVRALQNRNDADALATRMRADTGLPVEVFAADLGPRGVWYRLCVGDEDSVARIVARAIRWTAPGGILEAYLDPPSPHEARFLVHERTVADPRRPTVVQARALLALTREPANPPGAALSASLPLAPAEPVPWAAGVTRRAVSPSITTPSTSPSTTSSRSGAATTSASIKGDVWFAGTFEAPLAATTGDARDGLHSIVIVVDAEGALLPFDSSLPSGCASCAAAEAQSPVVSRRVTGSGDVLPQPGSELLVEEETADGSRILSLVVREGGALRRAGALLLSKNMPGVTLRGDAVVVEGDGDDGREIAAARTELRFSGRHLCTMSTRVELWNPAVPSGAAEGQKGLVRLDVMALAEGPRGDDAVVDYITAVDGAGDRDAASRACARVLAARPGTLVTQLCLQRVRSLLAEGRVVDAVNAAGTLSAGAPALRATVASLFFEAIQRLDDGAKVAATPWDCSTAPLIQDAIDRRADQLIDLARNRMKERAGLADVADDAFVTAARDFGPETPVGQIASRWLEQLRTSQPARHAALEALLLPAPDGNAEALPIPVAAPGGTHSSATNTTGTTTTSPELLREPVSALPLVEPSVAPPVAPPVARPVPPRGGP